MLHLEDKQEGTREAPWKTFEASQQLAKLGYSVIKESGAQKCSNGIHKETYCFSIGL